jgi:Family of unknown function (DUF6247)
MAAESVPRERPRDFRDASPREVRAALVPEEQADFDRTWRAAMEQAADTLDLSGVFATLDSWRTHAVITDELGHDGYRRWLARVDRMSRTGELPPGTVPLDEVKALIQERLGR